MRGLIQSVACMLAGAAIRDWCDARRVDRRRKEDGPAEGQKPLAPVILCEKCGRTAKRRCVVHNTYACGRCECRDCQAIRARVKAGTPRIPANYPIPVAEFAPHDPQTCRCPWCVKFDGPQATNTKVGMQ